MRWAVDGCRGPLCSLDNLQRHRLLVRREQAKQRKRAPEDLDRDGLSQPASSRRFSPTPVDGAAAIPLRTAPSMRRRVRSVDVVAGGEQPVGDRPSAAVAGRACSETSLAFRSRPNRKASDRAELDRAPIGLARGRCRQSTAARASTPGAGAADDECGATPPARRAGRGRKNELRWSRRSRRNASIGTGSRVRTLLR